MFPRGGEARELVRTEFLDTDRQWTVEDIQERLRDENLEDDFEHVLCEIARYGDDGILAEAEKASTILFLRYGWTIQTISMFLQDAPVEHLRKLKCQDQEVVTREVPNVEKLLDASEGEKEPKRVKTNEGKAVAPAKETVQRLEESGATSKR